MVSMSVRQDCLSFSALARLLTCFVVPLTLAGLGITCSLSDLPGYKAGEGKGRDGQQMSKSSIFEMHEVDA